MGKGRETLTIHSEELTWLEILSYSHDRQNLETDTTVVTAILGTVPTAPSRAALCAPSCPTQARAQTQSGSGSHPGTGEKTGTQRAEALRGLPRAGPTGPVSCWTLEAPAPGSKGGLVLSLRHLKSGSNWTELLLRGEGRARERERRRAGASEGYDIGPPSPPPLLWAKVCGAEDKGPALESPFSKC